MSTTLTQPEVQPTQYPLTLTDRLPQWAKLSWSTMLLVGLLGGVFAYASFSPLAQTDLFGHLAYGKLLWEARHLPAVEPFMPLSAGMTFIDSAWLSQVVGYQVHRLGGYPGLQFGQALLVTAVLTLVAWRLRQRTRHVGMTVAGLATLAIVGWAPLSVARPQTAATLFFVALLFLLTTRRWSRGHWVAIPALFVVWANWHESFLVGLVALGALVAGRAWDVIRRTGRIDSPFRDGPFRRLMLVTQLAFVATLVNPYGLRLYSDVLFFGDHPNLADLIEWQPLHLRSFFGLAMAGVALVLAFVYRHSPRRVPAGEVLLVVGLALAAMWSTRMLVWWAPVAVGALVWNWHAGALKARFGQPFEPVAGSSRWTVVTLGLIWISFAYTPFGMLLIHGKPTPETRSLSATTPIAAVEFLHKNPPQGGGQMFNTAEWGDYLLWAGPKDLRVFVTTHAQLVPTDVWQDYISVSNGSPDWQLTLDKYAVNTVLLDRAERRVLQRRLKDSDQWEKTYEDGLAAVYRRKKPI